MATTARKNLYIILPGSVTGDLWHVAAASILTTGFGPAGNFNYSIVPVIVYSVKEDDKVELEKAKGDQQTTKVGPTAISGNKGKANTEDTDTLDNEERKTERQNGAVNFYYFQNIGIDCMVVKVFGIDPGKGNIEKSMYGMGDTWFDEQFSKRPEMCHNFEHLSVPVVTTSEQLKGNPAEGSRVLRLMTATTIAMNFLCHKWPNLVVDEERLEYLIPRMSHFKDSTIDSEIEELATEQFNNLKKLITTAQESLKPKLPAGQIPKGVVLENYRLGHVNTQTDSNEDISNQFRRLAEVKGYAVVTIAAVKDADDLEKLKGEEDPPGFILDLYRKDKKKPWPGLDPRAQARFWAKVAKEENIFGVFGGRSGSIDVAGFNGVRALYWDEPWIELAAFIIPPSQDPDAKKGDAKVFDNAKNKNEALSQVAQALRSLQLLPLISVALPDLNSYKDGKWKAINETALKKWFNAVKKRSTALEKLIYPPCPEIKTWRLNYTLKEIRILFFERRDLQIPARLLDNLGYKSNVAKVREANKKASQESIGGPEKAAVVTEDGENAVKKGSSSSRGKEERKDEL